MIHVLINTLAEKMNEFLSSYYERAEIIVEAGSIDATPNEDQSDKIILSIVNIERETAMGISAPYRNTKNNTFQQTSPPWYLNIYIMVAAVFSSKRYLESIQILLVTINHLYANGKNTCSHSYPHALTTFSRKISHSILFINHILSFL